MQKNHDDKLTRSYGRIKNRAISARQNELMTNLLPKISVDCGQDIIHPHALFGHNFTQINLEIGFGNGKHLLFLAEKYPNKAFIGAEPFINGVASVLSNIDDKNINNVRLYNGDVRNLLDRFSSCSLDNIYILFPDPWPKERQKKRRLINQNLLDTLHKVLKPNGTVNLATDDDNYAQIMENLFTNSPLFAAQNDKDKYQEPADWVTTNYQQKAIIMGRKSAFFSYIKSTNY